MKKFIQNTFTKIRDYFTANLGRKIFFWGLFATILCFIISGVSQLLIAWVDSGAQYFRFIAQVTHIGSLIAIFVMMFGTLWDSMQSRVFFLRKIRDIQYDHLKTIYEKQEAGEPVAMTSTFSDDEKKFIRRRKWRFIFEILFKVILLITLFSLLLV